MIAMKKMLSWVGPSNPALASRRWSASGWHTKYWRAQGAATRVLQLAVLSCALGALLIDWAHVRQFAEEVEAKWSPAEVVPTALADMGRDLAEAQLPIEVNQRVEQWMVRFSTSDRLEFEQTLSRAGFYSDMIRGKLRARAMPEELIYLAMIESGFLTHARSNVSATGMWQFMDPTARAYGLRIDAYVDERRRSRPGPPIWSLSPPPPITPVLHGCHLPSHAIRAGGRGMRTSIGRSSIIFPRRPPSMCRDCSPPRTWRVMPTDSTWM